MLSTGKIKLFFLLFFLAKSSFGIIIPIFPQEEDEFPPSKFMVEFSIQRNDEDRLFISRTEIWFDDKKINGEVQRTGSVLSLTVNDTWIRSFAAPGKHSVSIRLFFKDGKPAEEKTYYFTISNKEDTKKTSKSFKVKQKNKTSNITLLHPFNRESIKKGAFYTAFIYSGKDEISELIPSISINGEKPKFKSEIKNRVFILHMEDPLQGNSEKNDFQITLTNPSTQKKYVHTSIFSIDMEGSISSYQIKTTRPADKTLNENENEKINITHSGTVFSANRSEILTDTNTLINEIGAYGSGSGSSSLDFNYNVIITNEGTDKQQTLNRYTLELGYKNRISMGIGDIYPYHNTFMLNGLRVRGLEVKTRSKSKFVNFDFVAGQTRNPIDRYKDGDALTDFVNQASSDTTLNLQDSALFYTPGTFSQYLLASRLHIGRGTKFKLGFSFLKARDLVGSISTLYKGDQFIGETPKDNFILGSDIYFFLWKKRIKLFGDVALSMLSNDITQGPSSLFSEPEKKKSTIEILENMEWLLLINSSTTPKPFDEEFQPAPGNLSSGVSADAGTRVVLSDRNHVNTTLIRYLWIGSAYQSLGNPYLGFDKKGVELVESYSYRPANISFRVAYQFYGDDVLNQKSSTKSTHNLNSSIAFNGTGTLPGVSMNYAGNYLNSEPKETANTIDNSEGSEVSATSIFSQSTRSHIAGLNTFYDVKVGRQTHNINLSTNLNTFSFSQESTASEFADQNAASDIDNSTVMYSGIVNTRIQDFPVRTKVGFSISVPDGENTLDIKSVSGGFTWNILERIVTFNTGLRYQILELQSSTAPLNNEEYNWNAGLNMYFKQIHGIIFSGAGTSRLYNTGDLQGQMLHTYRFTGNYEYNF